MMDTTLATLAKIVRRESRSLLQYVHEAFPWTTSEEQDALGIVQELVREELASAALLARYLAKHKAPVPYLGPFPMSFTTINFISLQHLLPMLVDWEKRAAAELEQDLAALPDPEARRLVNDLLAQKRRHLEKLHKLQAPPAQAA